MSRLIATVLYVGHIPFAPGTWGSLVALPLAWVIHGFTGFIGLALATILIFIAGWWATAQMTRGAADHDPSFIVVDEVAGQMIALWPLSFGLWWMGADPWLFPYPGWVGGFILFRLFDIWKPGPVGWADRQGGPFGVMLDDVIAGIMAAILITLGAVLAHVILI